MSSGAVIRKIFIPITEIREAVARFGHWNYADLACDRWIELPHDLIEDRGNGRSVDEVEDDLLAAYVLAFFCFANPGKGSISLLFGYRILKNDVTVVVQHSFLFKG